MDPAAPPRVPEMAMLETASILLVEDHPDTRSQLGEALRAAGYRVIAASGGREALDALARASVDLVLSDYWMEPMDGLALLRAVRRSHGVPFLLYGADAGSDTAFEAGRAGALRFLDYPFRIADQLLPTLADALAGRVRRLGPAPRGTQRLVGASQAMRRVQAAIRRVAPSGAPVLVSGETGTGKDLVARALHEESGRERFVAVAVTELSEGVLESELFGHVRGAFTGAVASRPGLFEAASGGTLFLDEVGDAGPAVQVKLLRALESREVRPVGGSSVRRVDVRVVAATNRDLPALVQRGSFREDLYYRLRGAAIHLPPLRERAEDLPALCAALLDSIAAGARLPRPQLSPECVDALARWPWRGNVRELRAVLENAVLWWDGDGPLDRAHLAEALVAGSGALAPGGQALAERMLDAWRRHGWNQEAARRELGLTRGEWRRRFARLGLDGARRRRRDVG